MAEEQKSPNLESKRTLRTRHSNDPLTKGEVELLLSRIDNLRDYTLLLFGFFSGVRVGEASFDYNSICWEEGFISVWDEKKDRYRRIYVPETVLNSLKRYWNEREDKRSPAFFDMSAKSMERTIQRWTSQVLNKPKSWHCVRHTYITLSFESSIPISVVVENTGDRPATILQYYTKLSPNFIKNEINQNPLFKTV